MSQPTTHQQVPRSSWRLLARDERGQNLVEYGLVVGLIGLAVILSMSGMGTRLRGAFSSMGSALSAYV